MTETPAHPKPTHTVGIGASAGGLEALQIVFQNMPIDAGISYIVIQHLSPDFKSLMAELLSKHTDMPVHMVTDGMTAEANTVYLIPPGKTMALSAGQLWLKDQKQNQGLNLPIDIFFRSLAKDQKENAVAIVLSGTGSDGSHGIQSINEAGGLVLVQEPSSAKFDGMPKSALNTGLADYTLPPEEIGTTLTNFLTHPAIANYTDGFGNQITQADDTMDALFSLLKREHKIDFSAYKASMVAQRIQRRLGISQCPDISEYFNYLLQSPQEQRLLTKELLIGSTSFFRDEDVFHCLEEHIVPQLLLKHDASNNAVKNDIRIWVPGCATGEEAYSIAILFDEALRKLNKTLKIRIFATDIDSEAITKASTGRFGPAITDDLSTERLHTYFSRRGNQFEVEPNIRQMVIFARQDVINDPPFPNIDLIACRNVLNYFQNGIQKKTLAAFHYALKPHGLLLMGCTESAEGLKNHFSIIDEQYKLYQKRANTTLVTAAPTSHAAVEPGQHKLPPITQVMRAHKGLQQLELIDHLKEDLMHRWAPDCLVVSETQEVLLTYGNIAAYTKPLGSGKISHALADFIADELALAIQTALHRAQREARAISFQDVQLTKPSPLTVTVHVQHVPVKCLEKNASEMPTPGHFIITLIQQKSDQKFDGTHDENNCTLTTPPELLGSEPFHAAELTQQRIEDLEQALAQKQLHLQDTVEALEATNEELHTSNEDLIAANEAMHSANEELQSANQELYVVNCEYQEKISELTEINDDVDNILASTNIGIMFLDRALLIRKFTQGVATYINTTAADIGRPFHHISNNINYPTLFEDIKTVNQNRTRHHKVVGTTDDSTNLLIQIIPYEASEKGADHHSGVVITLTNLSQLRALEETPSTIQQPCEQPMNAFVDALSTYLGTVRALLVDDEAADRKQISTQLAKIGHFKVNVTEAQDVASALSICDKERFDVCLIDYRIGGETALDFVRGLQRRQLKIPTIILSGYTKREVDHELLSTDIRDFLNKHELSPLLLQRSIQYAISRPAT